MAMKKSELLSKCKDYLILKNYRPNTIEIYLRSIENFFSYSVISACTDWDMADYAKAFLVHRFKDGKSWSSVNIDYSAIKILFVYVLRLEWDYQLVPRPRGRTSLPSVLSGRQVEAMINNLINLKHKTIVTLMYATGIRISELINLDVSHVLIDRAQLKVVKGKGGKDRIVAIPDIVLHLLHCYLVTYRPRQILIEGHPKQQRYSSSSVTKIIKRTARTVGVPFSVSAHSLRYAYATHHIENGTDLVSLQQQLGHNNISTTIKYVKLCNFNHRHNSCRVTRYQSPHTQAQHKAATQNDLGRIFRDYGEQYISNYTPDLKKIKLIRAMRVCKSPALGGRAIVCKSCQHHHYVYNSCGHSHCPICQAIKREQWIDKLKNELLNVPYVHMIFTLPHQLHSLARANKSTIYSLIMTTAWKTVKVLAADPKNIGGLPGMISVLHTFGSDLKYHIHNSCRVTRYPLPSHIWWYRLT